MWYHYVMARVNTCFRCCQTTSCADIVFDTHEMMTLLSVTHDMMTLVFDTHDMMTLVFDTHDMITPVKPILGAIRQPVERGGSEDIVYRTHCITARVGTRFMIVLKWSYWLTERKTPVYLLTYLFQVLSDNQLRGIGLDTLVPTV